MNREQHEVEASPRATEALMGRLAFRLGGVEVIAADGGGFAERQDDKAEASEVTEADLDRAYEGFAGAIERITEPDSGAEFVGTGSHSDVYKIEQDGRAFAVRVLKGDVAQRDEIIQSHVLAGVKGRGIQGLEKIVAASSETGVLVSEFGKGSHLEELDDRVLAELPDAHIDALLETRLQAMEAGLQFDAHPGNILYEPDSGFTDIDYHVVQQPYEAVNKLEAMKTILGSLDLTEKYLYEKESEKRQAYEGRSLALLRRINTYMENKFSPEEYRELWDSLVVTVSMRKAAYTHLSQKGEQG